ncbi:MoxR family ATPase [Frigoribacterium sp. CFBP 8754]|jgi:MoxR-like ATPase|nr:MULTISPECIES: MoxR family ATPase [Frigoribacterium]MBD8659080.1 MoxR family ATPase [Frigoribacterium sp. CFBP 8754]MBD8727375.1 MoxR family ATPase [Frigoribacterium sp. CFBP 13707]QNE45363.1 MoxR family ATPase [Frigoribacterium sp. NBH87]
MPLPEVQAAARRIMEAVATVIDGKDGAIGTALTVLLAEGHLLIEDVPGVGKTQLARALAKAVDARVTRIQFTPDLLPSDITGVSIYDRDRGGFEFTPGPVFANVVIGDEINRASPKTQSALLESLEERQVTVDGVTHPLPDPFLVVATQNPVEMEGTYSLPEAQRDRFMARISLGYPDTESELRMLQQRERVSPLEKVRPLVSLDELRRMIAAVRTVYTAEPVERYAVDVVQATRRHPDVRLGASPRATLQLMRAAKSWAALNGRGFVVPDDVDAMSGPVLGHRIILAGRAGAGAVSAAYDVVADVVASTDVPLGDTAGRR